MQPRELPPDLAAALRRARDLELAADGLDRQRRAIQATGSLMLAAVNAGWRRTELADALGIAPPAAQKRVQTARERYGDTRPALLIDGPPRRRPNPLDILKTPVADREWLSLAEAIEFTRHSAEVIKRWRGYGLLPNTQRVAATRLLYLRADLQRVLSAPRRGGVGIDRTALLATIRAARV